MAETSEKIPKVVFTDVDGTLLGDGHRLVPEAAPVIAELGRRGIPFVLVSARMPEALHPIRRALGFSGPLVCYSGAYVLDEEGNELLNKPMALDRAIEAKHYIDATFPDLVCTTYGYHTWICDDRSDPRIAEEERVVWHESVVARIEDAFDDRGIHKFLVIGEPERILEAERSISAAFPDLAVVRSSSILLEIMTGGVTKSEGVRLLCDHLGISIEDAVAFGDGHNDIDMLQAVPQSYAMANAPADVQRVAAHVTQLSNEENGLAVELLRIVEMPRG